MKNSLFLMSRRILGCHPERSAARLCPCALLSAAESKDPENVFPDVPLQGFSSKNPARRLSKSPEALRIDHLKTWHKGTNT